MSDDLETLSRAQLATRLRFLRIQKRTANFENREAIARKIRKYEAALEERP